MATPWCLVCQTRHESARDCPGELLASGPERHGWRVLVRTPTRAEIYGVLVSEVRHLWRARILTYPNMLWSVPGGRGTVKFVGETAEEAESQAIDFILEHCRGRGYEVTDEMPPVESVAVGGEKAADQQPQGSRDTRHLRSMVIRFGEEKTDRVGMTADLSRGGLYVISDNPFPAGTTIKLLLELEQFSVPLVGKVAWQRAKADHGRPAGMGVQLKNPPHLYARFVRTLGEAESETGAERK